MESPMPRPETPAKRKYAFSHDALLVAGAIIVSSLIIAFAVRGTGMLSSKTSAPAQQPAQQGAAAGNNASATTSLDDDPVLGDKAKAKVAIVEFSDYECPFCKRFHADTFDSVVKDYVNTGKAVLAFRDFPLSFHEPVATAEAATAECIGQAKGNQAYFDFGKQVYANTQANGQGLPAGKLDELIRSAGADPKQIASCAGSDAVKQEIAKDIADGGKVGVNGTPSFIVGTLSSDGTVTGELVVGAVPYDQLKVTLDKYLKQ